MWVLMEEIRIDWLTKMLNKILSTRSVPHKWREKKAVVLHLSISKEIFKTVQTTKKIKLMNRMAKLWKKVNSGAQQQESPLFFLMVL